MAGTVAENNVPSSEVDSTPPPSYSSFYNEPSAEFIVVSSDDIHFRTHKYVLQTMSSVFRDMLQLGSEQRMCLPDTSSEVLRCALDVLNGVKLDISQSFPERLSLLEDIFDFSEKYDSPIVKLEASRALDDTLVIPDAFEAFRIATRLRSLPLAQRALTAAAKDQVDSWTTRLDIFTMSDEDIERLGWPGYRALIKAHAVGLPVKWHPDFASVTKHYKLP